MNSTRSTQSLFVCVLAIFCAVVSNAKSAGSGEYNFSSEMIRALTDYSMDSYYQLDMDDRRTVLSMALAVTQQPASAEEGAIDPKKNAQVLLAQVYYKLPDTEQKKVWQEAISTSFLGGDSSDAFQKMFQTYVPNSAAAQASALCGILIRVAQNVDLPNATLIDVKKNLYENAQNRLAEFINSQPSLGDQKCKISNSDVSPNTLKEIAQSFSKVTANSPPASKTGGIRPEIKIATLEGRAKCDWNEIKKVFQKSVTQLKKKRDRRPALSLTIYP